MKKSLLALAVLGAFAGAAQAQSSVTIYGVVDTGFTSFDNGADRTNGISSGNNAASRIGFKGMEDLGNGLKAEFVLENGINTDTGGAANSDAAFSRLAFVGLNGGFGKVRLGRQETQMKEMLGKVDPFGAAGLVNAHDFVNGGDLDQRVSNQVTWISNNYAGFSGSVGYIFGETAGSTSANNGFGVRVSYDNGPLGVHFAYEKQNSTDVDAATNTVIPGGNDLDNKNVLLGATYDFSAFKLHGLFGEGKQDQAGGGDIKIRSYLAGVTVPFGASAIRAEYIRNDNRDVADSDANVYALSYTYSLSKRTTLYATYVHVSNDDGSTLGLGGGDFAASAGGESVSGTAIGVNHKF